MNSKNEKLGYTVRFLIGGAGVALLVLFAQSTYMAWTINGFYFHDYSWPGVGWGDVLWLTAAVYLVLAGCAGKWRFFKR